MKILSAVLLSFWFCIASAVASEEAADGKEAAAQTVEYINIQPPFVGNFGTASPTGKLGYVKTEIALRITGQAAKTAVEYHMPYIRNELVLLLGRQDLVTMTTSEGKERLRQEALEKVNAVLQQEEGKPMVDDLLFSTFVIQH